MTNRSFIVLLLLLSLIAGPSFAVRVSLYEADVPVPSQTAEARTEAARAAFEQVLIRMTGDKDILSNPVLRECLAKAGYFVQEYRYALPSTNASEYLIHIRFDEQDINRLLKRAGVDFWGAKRPLILIFLAFTKSNGEIEVIGDDQTNNLASEVKSYSTQYGLPTILPAMDMEDLNQFTPEDVSGMLIPTLKAAGKRYAPDVYLIGNIQQTFGGYSSQWQMLSIGVNKQWNWSRADRTTDQIIANAMDEVMQKLSNRHIAKKIDPADIWVRLEVTNILAREELTQLVEYLKAISVVRDVQLSQVSNDSVKIAVLVRGSLDTFLQTAKSGQHLQLKGEYRDANILLYEWVQ